MKLDPEAASIFQQVANQFFDSVVELSAESASMRKSDRLELSDVKFVLEKYYNQHMPEYGLVDTNRQIVKHTPQHMKRLSAVKKFTKNN